MSEAEKAPANPLVIENEELRARLAQADAELARRNIADMEASTVARAAARKAKRRQLDPKAKSAFDRPYDGR